MSNAVQKAFSIKKQTKTKPYNKKQHAKSEPPKSHQTLQKSTAMNQLLFLALIDSEPQLADYVFQKG